MLQSFADKETEQTFHGIHTHAIRKHMTSDVLKIVERRLDLLHCAESYETLEMIPGLKEEGLVRDAHGKYSIPILGNMRIAFRWEKDGPSDVEIKF